MRSAIREALADPAHRDDDSVSTPPDDIEARTNAALGDDGKICRICHGGAEDGRLISPCLCKGSMMFVHIACLQRWRAIGDSRHYFRCDTCHYEYQLRRVAWARWLSKAWVSHLLTFFVLFLLVLVAGYVGRLLSAISFEASEHLVGEEAPVGIDGESNETGVLLSSTSYSFLAASYPPLGANNSEAPAEPQDPALPPRPTKAHPQLLIWQETESESASEKGSWRDNWSWSFLSLEHWIAGTTVVGLASFVIFATFPGVIFRGNIGRGGGGGGGNGNLELAILALIVVIGVVKAFLTLQRVVLRKTRLLVLKAEEHILEVKSSR